MTDDTGLIAITAMYWVFTAGAYALAGLVYWRLNREVQELRRQAEFFRGQVWAALPPAPSPPIQIVVPPSAPEN